MVVPGFSAMTPLKKQVVLTAQESAEWLWHLRRLGTPERVMFMDIETTGFSRNYDSVYLIGYLYLENGAFCAEQHLSDHLGDEIALLETYAQKMDDYDVCVTFNGEAFDFPFLAERWKVLRRKGDLPKVRSVDLYRRFRPYAKLFGWPNCRLKTIETFLSIDRQDEFDGGALIDVFYEYARTNDPALQKTLLLHNYEDILNLPRLLRIESFMAILKEETIEEVRLDRALPDRLRFRAAFQEPLPLSFEGARNLVPGRPEQIIIRTEAGSPVLFFELPLFKGERSYYLPNPENYYYLPETDSIVHKSLIGTMDTTGRRKATKKNCRIVRNGEFLVCRDTIPGLHAFYEGLHSPLVYYEKRELTDALEAGNADWSGQWVRSLLML